MNFDRTIQWLLGRNVMLPVIRDDQGRIVAGEPIDVHLFRPQETINCRCVLIRKTS